MNPNINPRSERLKKILSKKIEEAKKDDKQEEDKQKKEDEEKVAQIQKMVEQYGQSVLLEVRNERGGSILHLAIENGCGPAVLEYLLKEIPGLIHTMTRQGQDIFFWALCNRHKKAVIYFLKRTDLWVKHPVKRFDKEGFTALYYAACMGDKDFFLMIKDSQGNNDFFSDDNTISDSALSWPYTNMADEGSLDLFEYLTEEGIVVSHMERLKEPDDFFENLFKYALQAGKIKFIEYLETAYGFTVKNSPLTYWDFTQTVLKNPINCIEVFDFLIKRKALFVTEKNCSALLRAVVKPRAGVPQPQLLAKTRDFLLEKGLFEKAISSLIIEGLVPNYSEAFQLFIHHGWNPLVEDKCGETALLKVVRDCDFRTAELLINHGAKLYKPNKHGHTILHKVSDDGRLESVKWILSKTPEGELQSVIDLPIADDWGNTALSQAARNGHLDIVQLLAEKGADIKANKKGWTPLHRAATGGYINVATWILETQVSKRRFLLEAQVEIMEENVPVRRNAMEIALQNNHLNVALILQQHMEKLQKELSESEGLGMSELQLSPVAADIFSSPIGLRQKRKAPEPDEGKREDRPSPSRLDNTRFDH